ncbi:MAG: SurA N-terminal domain-containing protein [Sphingomonadales bacterium]
MLEAIRSGVGSWFVKIFLGLLILSFAVWGIGDIFRTAIDTSVAVVGNVKIANETFIAEFDRQLRAMRNRFGGGLDTQTAVQLGLADSVINRMVSRSALDQTVDRLGLRIPDHQVRREIQSNKAFQDEFGDFDRFQFDRTMYSLQMSERQFIADTRANLARSQLVNTLVAGSRAPRALAEAIYRHRFEKRSAEFFIIGNEDIKGIGDPDDDAIAAYHQDHVVDYTAPEYRKISFITLAPADVASEIGISDEELLAEYERRADEFGTTEKRTVAQIAAPDREKADELYRNMDGGLGFAQAAFDIDGSSIDDITLGAMDRRELSEMLGDDVADKVFALAEGAVSEPVETSFGWRLFLVTEVVAAQSRPFEEVKSELRENLALEQATDALFEYANRIDDMLAGGADIAEAADAVGLKVRAAGPIDSDGRDTAGQKVASLPKLPTFMLAAFRNEIGEELFLEESPDGVYFVVQVDDIIPRAARPVEDVRDAVITAWKTEQRNKAARERADKLVEVARDGGDFAALAEGVGRKVEKAASFDRNGAGARPAMSRQLIARLFELPVGGHVVTATIGEDGYIVARLTGETPGDPFAADADLAGVDRSLSSAMANDVLAQYQAALSAELGIEINRGLMLSLFDNPAGGAPVPLPH